MTFHEYQELTGKTAIYKQEIDAITEEVKKGLLGGFTPDSHADLDKINKLLKVCYATLGLGEVGEAQGKIKKLIRDAKGEITEDIRMKIAHELGDVLWYVSQLCDELDLSLEMVADINVTKLKSRMERGTIKGSGDER